MAHNHNHSHHDHSHGEPMNYNTAFGFGIALNMAFVVIEFGYGYVSHSLALMADAGHNLSDVLGLALAWGAFYLAKKRPSQKFTYGYKSSSILAALANAVLLLVAIGGIIWEAVHRFNEPTHVEANTVMIVAAIGILINGATALLFTSGRHKDLNLKGAYLHMVADAAVSAGVVVAGFIIGKTGFVWIDPVVSLIICAIIIWGTWCLLKDSVKLALNAVPESINSKEIYDYFRLLSGVSQVHDLHIWGMSTTENALTVHLICQKDIQAMPFLKR